MVNNVNPYVPGFKMVNQYAEQIGDLRMVFQAKIVLKKIDIIF